MRVSIRPKGLGGALKATVGSAIGNEEWVESGLAYYRKKMQDAANVGANVTSVEEIDSFGDFTDWAGYTLGTLVPDVVGGGVAVLQAKAGAKSCSKTSSSRKLTPLVSVLLRRLFKRITMLLLALLVTAQRRTPQQTLLRSTKKPVSKRPEKALAVGVAQGLWISSACRSVHSSACLAMKACSSLTTTLLSGSL